MKLLLVEDDSTTVESIKLCLEIGNPEINVLATNKGFEALSMLRNESFDAVLLDLGLPDMDGLDLIEQMRSFSQVPVMVISARQSPEVVSRAMASGANDYLTKPYYYQKLLARLNILLSNAS
jgi:DNA-binding response OmpR family regulator